MTTRLRHLARLAAGVVAAVSVASCSSSAAVEVAASDPASPPSDDAMPSGTSGAASLPVDTTAPATPETTAPSTDPHTDSDIRSIVLHGGGQVMRVAAGGEASPAHAGDMVAASGRSSVSLVIHDGMTTVQWSDDANTADTNAVPLDGRLDLTAVSFDGDVAALRRTIGKGAATRTEVVLAGRDGAVWRHTYDGDYAPEAIETSPGLTEGTLFVIETIHDAPIAGVDPYRVVAIDLATYETRVPFSLRNKAERLDETMAGLSRTQVAAVADGMLFTLYRGIEASGRTYAFVHSLWTVGGVYCLLLPAELGLADTDGSISLSADRRTLVVAAPNGLSARYDVQSVRQAGDVQPTIRRFDGGGTGVPLVASTAEGDWIARDTAVVTPTGANVDVGQPVTALVPDSSGGVLVAAGDTVTRLGADGTPTGSLTAPFEVDRIISTMPY